MSCFLFHEGPTDAYFLPRVLERGLTRLCAKMEVEIAAVQPLPKHSGDLVAGVCGAALGAVDGATFFFYHYDGSAVLERETGKYWEPLCREWTRRELPRRVVRVVPIREMEAWALADIAVIRRLFGHHQESADVFEHQLLGRPEQLTDPKRTLKELLRPTDRPTCAASGEISTLDSGRSSVGGTRSPSIVPSVAIRDQ